jgi:peptidoglycan hydrolase-like protein with peptidoglycan-binding domain
MIYGFIISQTDSYQGKKMSASVYLKKGMKGSAVTKLQKLLKKAVSPSPKLKIDGDFGDDTLNAVLHFQKAAKIKIDGVVGKKHGRQCLSPHLSQNILRTVVIEYFVEDEPLHISQISCNGQL